MTGAADGSARRHISFAKWGGPVVDGGLVYTIRWFTNADFCSFGAPAPEARNISTAYGFRESSASRFPLDQETRHRRDPKVDRLHRPRKSMALTARRRRNAKAAAKSSLWAGLRRIPKPASKISPVRGWATEEIGVRRRSIFVLFRRHVPGMTVQRKTATVPSGLLPKGRSGQCHGSRTIRVAPVSRSSSTIST